jgi:hypothetical protein
MVLSEHVINVLAAVIAVGYIDYGFEKKYEGLKRWAFFVIGCSVYFFVMTGMNRLTSYEGIFCVLYGAVLVFYGSIALKGSLQDKILLSIMWILITFLGTFTVYGLIGILTGQNMGDIMGIEGIALFFASVLASVIKLLMGRIVVIFYGKRENLHKSESWMVAGVLILNLLVGLGMFQLELGKMSERMRCGLILCLLAGAFGGILLLETVYRKLGEYQKEKMELEFRGQQEKSIRENLMDIYRIDREINHWRHDMNEKLEVLYRLQSKGCYREVEKNMEQLCEELKRYPELPQETGNEGLNVALMKAVVRCKDEGIKFSYVILGKADKINSIDMGTLMWNLFSNGIEACQKVQNGRFMDVVVRDIQGETEIYLENSVQESVLKQNPNLLSGKAHKEKHGFGMETIYMLVEKYHGEYSCWEEENRFIQEIYLKPNV